MSNSPAHYPFSAIVGQTALKTALTLSIIEPALGGVLIAGPRGSAKSTLARGLTAIAQLPPEQFVNLPLGATEEKIVGSLDLDKILNNGHVAFSPGLLQRAHQGILYVDEINLLADHLVDLLLDVTASGINYVERDGISHQHPAQFNLIGTMNPDEGELRPQLLDRFGLYVQLNEPMDIQKRIEIVQRRLAFDDDANAFNAQYQSAQNDMIKRIQLAKALLKTVQVSHENQQYIAQTCQAAHVEGIRADLTLLRAARAYSAWQNRQDIRPADIDFVAEFALSHRRNQPPTAPPPKQSAPPPNTNPPPPKPPAAPQGQWGEMPPIEVSSRAIRTLELATHKKKS